MSYIPPATTFISTANSTTTPLASSGVFTGTSEDISQYAVVTVLVVSNIASATDGLSIQQSTDGTNWDNIDAYTVPAATAKTFSVQVTARYLRVVYTNSATLQTSFRLQTVLHYNGGVARSVRPQDARTNDNDMDETLAYLMGYNGASWDRLRTTGTGVLTVSAAVTSLPATPIGTNTIGAVYGAVRTTGGATTFTLISAASTNATSVKASAGTVYSLSLGNNGASAAYVKLYNKASAPTVGTDTPVATYLIPAGGGREVVIPMAGLAFGTGIAYAITGAGTVADTTAVAATQVFVNGSYN